MQSTIDRLPSHLKKYIVSQNYSKYTPEDQAIWRYILRQLKDYLQTHAHEAYIVGLEKTGISEDEIPKIEHMDSMLKNFGWGAVPISGFIPPAAFMEFQSLSVLPIATDLRSIEHILYTPAPDIVHESAGHAPILIDPSFSKYLKEYASIASNAIFSLEDLEVYEAVRELSDVKEDPNSSETDIKNSEEKLNKAVTSVRYASEANLLSRMNWWTAEYGLIGDINNPKIFGAGLLSSIGEAKTCLEGDVKKIPLTLDCINTTYDITEKQPQLFVTKTFENLITVLHELSESMSYKKGGMFGLDKAIEARTVNTIQLNSGLQISGVLKHYLTENNELAYLQFVGPTQLSFERKQLEGHSTQQHPEGFGCPIGFINGIKKCPSKFSDNELSSLGIVEGSNTLLAYDSGISVEGKVESITKSSDKVLLIKFTNCTVKNGDDILFSPDWGEYDMASGSEVDSVFGGPAHREVYGDTIDFVAKIIPPKEYSEQERKLHRFFSQIRDLRVRGEDSSGQLNNLVTTYLSDFSTSWLAGLELFEISKTFNSPSIEIEKLSQHLNTLSQSNSSLKPLLEDGLRIIEERTHGK